MGLFAIGEFSVYAVYCVDERLEYPETHGHAPKIPLPLDSGKDGNVLAYWKFRDP